MKESLISLHSKYKEELESSRQQKAKDTELFRLSSDKVVAEAF